MMRIMGYPCHCQRANAAHPEPGAVKMFTLFIILIIILFGGLSIHIKF